MNAEQCDHEQYKIEHTPITLQFFFEIFSYGRLSFELHYKLNVTPESF